MLLCSNMWLQITRINNPRWKIESKAAMSKEILKRGKEVFTWIKLQFRVKNPEKLSYYNLKNIIRTTK